MTLLESVRANVGCARVIVRRLSEVGGRAPRVETLRAVAPPGLGGYEPGTSGNALDETVGVLSALDIVRRDGEDLVLSLDAASEVDVNSLVGFRTAVRRALFAVVADADPFETGMTAVAGGLAWLLAQDPLKPIGGWSAPHAGLSDPQRLQEEQLGFRARILKNDRQWPVFVRWAQFLGFAEAISFRPGAITSDPTRAVQDELAKVQSGPAADVVAALADLLPVLDGGAIRERVEERWRVGRPPSLSPSLSCALARLERSGQLTLTSVSDAPAGERALLHLGTQTRSIARIEVMP